MRGRFITFEGGEGAGKSTQAKVLATRLRAAGIDVVETREPGGTPGAEAIRALVVAGDPDRWDGVTEALLMNAARADHVTRRIRPALAAGQWVVCDRYVDSTLAYQGAGKGLSTDALRATHRFATNDLWPDVTLVLDLPARSGSGRAAQRGALDRFEKTGGDFHEVVAAVVPRRRDRRSGAPPPDRRDRRHRRRCRRGVARGRGPVAVLIGHAEQGRALREAVVSGRVHHAWLLAGPKGVGKARFAHAAATWLLARAAHGGVADDDFAVPDDHPTARLLSAGSHIDFRVVEILDNPRTKKPRPGISVDQFVRTDTTIGEPLNTIFRTRPALSDWRVIVIDAADDLNRNAANAFLKHLEEPPPNTLFLAVSHSPSRLLPTIRSRCRVLRFHALADDEVDAVLARELADTPDTVRAALRAVAEGRPGRALQLADADVAGLRTALDGLARANPVEAAAQGLALARSLAGKTAGARFAAFLELVPAYIAAAARPLTGARLARAIDLWEQAQALAAVALPQSLDVQATAFRLAELVADLSRTGQVHEIA